MTESNAGSTFESDLPVAIFIRPLTESGVEWSEYDHGPGRFDIPQGHEISLRVRNIDDDELYDLVKAVSSLPALTTLNLSENRKISDAGLARLTALNALTSLNVSSCSITNQGLSVLAGMKKLQYLNISYCNRISDEGLKHLKPLNRLTYLDIQGCVKTSHAGVKKIERRGLTIHR